MRRHQEANREYPHEVEGSDKDNAIATSTATKNAPTASISDPALVRTANQCLALSTRAPNGIQRPALSHRTRALEVRQGKHGAVLPGEECRQGAIRIARRCSWPMGSADGTGLRDMWIFS
ncbi:hypothetical protein ACHAW5_008365 [Stephanodiscus triporus]|uniref:Uncharacterized protein n=1 Tax=Stephanodiscus triporus TaxID=2934178 RepID=A0ABD3MXP0_9STRA